MPAPKREVSAPPSLPCEWRGDPAEPELDDLAYQHAPRPPKTATESCDWRGDPAEPEYDDLAGQHKPNTTRPALETKEPESTPFEPPTLPTDALPLTLPLLPVTELPAKLPIKPTEEPQDHHLNPPALPQPEPRQVTPPPQLITEPTPMELTKEEKEKKHKEERARDHEEKRRAKKEKERAKKELREKERAVRKAREKEKREAREKEKQEKRARKKSRGHKNEPVEALPPVQPLQEVEPEPEPEPEQSPPEPRDEATEDTESKLPGVWQGLPTFNNLTEGIRKILPKAGSFSKSRRSSAVEGPLCPPHQLQEDIDQLNKHLNQHLKDDKRHGQQGKLHHPSRKEKNDTHHKQEHHEGKHVHIGTHHHGAGYHHHKTTGTDQKIQGLDGASDPRPRIKKDQSGSVSTGQGSTTKDGLAQSVPQNHSAQPDTQPDQFNRMCECAHSSTVPRIASSPASQAGEPITSEHDSQHSAPSRLKRASCLCGAMPPNPTEFAEYETPPFLTPRIDTPGHKDPFAAESYFEK